MMGTPAFMPPEQARGRRDEIDARADVWAMGATMFTLLAGRYVHDAETLEETLVFAATQAAPALESVAPGVPPEVAAVVDRALAFAKEQRWAHAGAMRDALSGAHRLSFRTAPPARHVSGDESAKAGPPPPVGAAVALPDHVGANTGLATAPTQASNPVVPRPAVASTTAGTTRPPWAARPGGIRGRVAALLVVAAGIMALAVTLLRGPRTADVSGDPAKSASVAVAVPSLEQPPPQPPAPAPSAPSPPSASVPPPPPAARGPVTPRAIPKPPAAVRRKPDAYTP
jgi:serine/threonine-protein kinase